MKYGFYRAACASPDVLVGSCAENAEKIIEAVRLADKDGVLVLVTPELSITGYTCGDLFLQTALLDAASESLRVIAQKTADIPVLFYVGFPVRANGSLYNCAAAVYKGRVIAVIPKTHIPNYSEFYEMRHFTPYDRSRGNSYVHISGFSYDIPFGTDILIRSASDSRLTIAAEICEDVWVMSPPSADHAKAGASVIVNLSASNEIIGKRSYRRMLTSSQSGRLCCAYVYADAGPGESTTDTVFANHNIITENGSVLAECEPFGTAYTAADIDVELLAQERLRMNTFSASVHDSAQYTVINVDFDDCDACKEDNDVTPSACSSVTGVIPLLRPLSPFPFVPQNKDERSERCREIIELQSRGLVKRIKHTNAQHLVIGLSGGLDSTLALLVSAEAFRFLGRALKDITAVTMPCFGTTDRTYKNAKLLASSLGVTLREIPLAEAVSLHLRDIGHDSTTHDAAYENAQARERTQVLMDIANMHNGLVIGTGDLSESALGWSTYNGDHMSMYGVNSSIPKTLVRYLVQHEAEKAGDSVLSHVLFDILDTPVSPELIPAVDGKISQKTEEIVGPYELHDFFLYYMVRRGFSPSKIFYLAQCAFSGTYGVKYDKEVILKWMKIFYRRFFSQQFKRSCMPDGAKVGTVSLSPRADWRMPSDASAAVWLAQLSCL